ncbi:MAG: hypothetical protein E7300_00810 [Lachnospiraceae bacterium]|nr:hypothetical protein [Lachnospiraceae bacterium]
MLSTEKMLTDYDDKHDVMTCMIRPSDNSYGDEDEDNIVILKDIDTDEVTGYTILDFKKICREKGRTFDLLRNLLDVDYLLKTY